MSPEASEADGAVLSDVRWPEPPSPLLTACEVMTWLALGEAYPFSGIPLWNELFEIWGLEPRNLAALAEALRVYVDDPTQPLESVSGNLITILSYTGADRARHFEALLRNVAQKDPTILSFGKLLDRLGDDCEHWRIADRRLELAGDEILHRVRDQKLTAYGRVPHRLDELHPPFGSAPKDNEDREIPFEVFLDRSLRLHWWDTIESDRAATLFENVQFRTAQVLAIWPAQEARTGLANAKRTAAQSLKLQKWLTDRMRQSPDQPRPKKEIKAQARAAGLTFGERAFGRAWLQAASDANAPAWTAPGARQRPPKSSH